MQQKLKLQSTDLEVGKGIPPFKSKRIFIQKLRRGFLFEKTPLRKIKNFPQKLSVELKKKGVHSCESLVNLDLGKKPKTVKQKRVFYNTLFGLGFNRPTQKKHYYKAILQYELWKSKARCLVRPKKAKIIQAAFRLFLANRKSKRKTFGAKPDLQLNRLKNMEEKKARWKDTTFAAVKSSLKTLQTLSGHFVQAHFSKMVLKRSNFILQSHFTRVSRGCETLSIDVCYKPALRTEVHNSGNPFRGILTVLNGEGYILLCNLLYTNESAKEVGIHLSKLKDVMLQIDGDNCVKTIYTDTCCRLRNELTNIFPEAKVRLDGFHWLQRWQTAFTCGKDHLSFKVFYCLMSFAVYAPDRKAFSQLVNEADIHAFAAEHNLDDLEVSLLKKIRKVTKVGKLTTTIQLEDGLRLRINVVVNAFKRLCQINDWKLDENRFEVCFKKQLRHLRCLSDPAQGPQTLTTLRKIDYMRATGRCEAFNATINHLLRKFSHISPQYLHSLILRLVEETNARKDVLKYGLTGLRSPILQSEVVSQLNSITHHLFQAKLISGIEVQPLNCNAVYFGVESRPPSCNLVKLRRYAHACQVDDKTLLRKLGQQQSIDRDIETYNLPSSKWIQKICAPFKVPMPFNSKEKEYFSLWRRCLDYKLENNLDKASMDWSLQILRSENTMEWMKPKEANHFRKFLKASSSKQILRPAETSTIVGNVLSELSLSLTDFAHVGNKLQKPFCMSEVKSKPRVPVFFEYTEANKILPLMAYAPLRPNKVPATEEYIQSNLKLYRIRKQFPAINWRIVCCNCGKRKSGQHTKTSGFGVNCRFARATLRVSQLTRLYPKSSTTRVREVKQEHVRETKFAPQKKKPKKEPKCEVEFHSCSEVQDSTITPQVTVPVEEQISCLLPGEQITNFVVDDYVELVQHKEHRNDAAILPSYYFSFECPMETFNHALKKFGKSTDSIERYYIPCLKDTHWYFIEVKPRAKTMVCYNSLDGAGYNHKKDFELVSKGFSDLGVGEKNAYSFSENCTRRQGNQFDCGAFMLASIERLYVGRDLADVTQRNMPKFRERIRKSLLEKRLVRL